MPISIGVAPTKTLAKVANHTAKRKGTGIFDIIDPCVRQNILTQLPVENIWGVGRNIATKLKELGIITAAQLVSADEKLIHKLFGVTGEKIVLKLRGMSCNKIDDSYSPRKNIIVSRLFCKKVTAIEDLEEAVGHYTATACAKMRRQRSKLCAISVFITTSKHRGNLQYYRDSMAYLFDEVTDDTMLIIKKAKECLKTLYRSNYIYYKTGVTLLGLKDDSFTQGNFIKTVQEDNSELMKIIDSVNAKMGKHILFIASQGIKRGWQIKNSYKSPNYTTNWNEIMQVR